MSRQSAARSSSSQRVFFFFSSRRRHTRSKRDGSSDVCSSDLLGAGAGPNALSRVALDSGIQKQLVKVALPREEHHQTSDLEQLCAAVGLTPGDVGTSVLQGLPAALRDDPDGVTVTTFAA